MLTLTTTRQSLKSLIIKQPGSEDTYMMFFQILRDDDDETYFFNMVGLFPEEIKALKPIKYITTRRMNKFFRTNYEINDMGKYREEREIINYYFPTPMYEDPETKAKYFVLSYCQKYLENKGLLRKIPDISVVSINNISKNSKK
jgi:hypothetical protein